MIAFVLGLILGAQAGTVASDGWADLPRGDAKKMAAALSAHAPDVHGCYAQVPEKRAEGELLVRVTLGEREHVERAEILKDHVGSPALSRCLQERMLAWNLPGLGAAGTQVVFPLIFKAEAQTEVGAKHTVALADVHPVPKTPAASPGKPPRVLPLQTWLLIDEVSVGAKRAAMALVQIGPKAKVARHRHPQSAELLYVLDGKGRLLLPGLPPEKLEAGTAVYLQPGLPHSLDDQSNQKPLRLLQVFVPPGPERVLRDRSQHSGTEIVRTEPPRASAKSYAIVREDEVKPLSIVGGKGKAWLLLDQAKTGSDAVYLGLLEAQAGAQVPLHQHAGTEELLYVTAGKGKVTIAGAAAPVAQDMAIDIPEDTDHSASFSEDTRAIQVYVPGGAEQRFKQPAKAAAPAGPK